MNRSPFAHEITPTPTKVECVAETRSIAGESPVWSVAEKCLYFVDHQGHKIHRYRPAEGGLDTFDLPGVVTSLAPRRSGGLIVTIERRFAFFDPDSGRLEDRFSVEPELPDNRFNDGKCDRQGRFWAGTMGKIAWDSPCGSLYRLAGEGAPERMRAEIRCSNGLAWSPDDRTFYYAESFAYMIHAFDFDAQSGTIGNRHVFASLDPRSGAFPDGLTVDVEGCVWNAQPVFGRIVRYDPQGKLDRIVETPVSRCTSCIFGDDDLGTMYVTSARETLTAAEIEEEPLAGGLFAFRPGVHGIAEVPFAG
ncbi:MAG: SMP-30/gluconolactonase/LRE family protein [Methylobacteriaceae bacterium]|nr:SMP-30/gluconolactonase/LRE family protein [Methylobacteriaceae bacterium]